ncbi:MAG: M20 metallopeptidase family protein [Chloroflexota bacterium]
MALDQGLLARIRVAAERQHEYMVAIRRDLHAHPEIAFQEYRTSRLVATEMERGGLAVRTGVAKTGAVGLLRGTKPGKTVALRADIDALPYGQQSDKPYRSQVPNAAHLCGHDAHAAMLLGAARVLSELKDELPGNVKFLAEPAEEMANAEGLSGAEQMIADGALADPAVDAIFAIHVFPEYPTGTIAVRAGSIMAGHGRFDITMIGKEAHAATPNLAVDPVPASARLIDALFTFGQTAVVPGDTFLVNVGTIHAGHAYNLIPDRVEMVGSVRTGDEVLRAQLGERLERVVRGIADAADATYEFKFNPYTFPATCNDPSMADLVRRTASSLLGEQAVVWMDRPRLTGETFCHYLDRVPGAYVILGTGNEAKGTTFSSHHARFDIDEDALPAGAATAAACALAYLATG